MTAPPHRVSPTRPVADWQPPGRGKTAREPLHPVLGPGTFWCVPIRSCPDKSQPL
jgi:hypothetical protein